MSHFHSGQCPVCHSPLQIERLSCPKCKAEYPICEPLSPYDYLTEAQSEFLTAFLVCRGNQKLLGEKLQLSHPTVKKRLEELLIALGYEKQEEKKDQVIDMSVFGNIDFESTAPSEIVKKKLYENGGIATIPLLDGGMCKVLVSSNGQSFTSDKLTSGYGRNITYEYRVFNDIVELLKSLPSGKAPKGNAHGKKDKVGFGKCTKDTVVGTIAINYAGKSIGESTYDPVFVLAAILDWAGIAYNKRGYIELTTEYKALINNN